jgi:hypothetical protein
MVDGGVRTFDPAKIAKTLPECVDLSANRRIDFARQQSYSRCLLGRLLGERAHWISQRADRHTEKLSPPHGHL